MPMHFPCIGFFLLTKLIRNLNGFYYKFIARKLQKDRHKHGQHRHGMDNRLRKRIIRHNGGTESYNSYLGICPEKAVLSLFSAQIF